ncbi:MAG: SAM-dependent methyltransferase [Bacteroidales bacterium]|nr:SAM-dependent methyltransferase [Bacteroidales bacterium]
MKTVLDANISDLAYLFLFENLKQISDFESANILLKSKCGINNFFADNEDFYSIITAIDSIDISLVSESDRAEYGDFQTNKDLAHKVTRQLASKNINPQIIIEPTCGKGNFIIASLSNFDNIEIIIGVEIYKPYIWETKFGILDFYINNPENKKPEILIFHDSIFNFNIKDIAKETKNHEVLIIGNPPWVTNSKLGSLSSKNLPKKSNFKNQNGLDAMTGKGNFDIAEYIVLMLFDNFQNHNGNLALLVKNSVIKNVVFSQRERMYQIARIEKHAIDSKAEFNVSVESSLLYCMLNQKSDFVCNEYDFYNKSLKSKFGWLDSKFVSDIGSYNTTNKIDGKCQFEWRQGIKHDCSSVMELEKQEKDYINKLSDTVSIENDLVYGLLKSSDLKEIVIGEVRKYTIVTQSKVGQDTSYINHLYPKTQNYLGKYKELFDSRKSSIYRGNPPFSIFGVGEYSFKPFKVAISGLYKTFHFSLVLPIDNKPVMLDDTCYFIGFDKFEHAIYSLILLNSDSTKLFLKSVTFSDAKRVFTKEVLMRLDLISIANLITKNEISNTIELLEKKYNLLVNMDSWEDFIKSLKPKQQQLQMF